MLNPSEQGDAIVNKYNELTGAVARPKVYERLAFDFMAIGFSQDDLELVVRHLQRENAKNDFKYSLDLRRLLSDHQTFNDHLSRATAIKSRQRTPAQKVLNEFRRITPEDAKDSFRSIGEVIKKSIQ
jgi:hypothetical protein